jgi:hypothetical protein
VILAAAEVFDISNCSVYSFGILVCNLISNQLALDNGKEAKHDIIPALCGMVFDL